MRVIEQNEFIFALSKPTGVHSLALKYSESNNLLSYLRDSENSADIFLINQNSYEKGLLYRLDYETSGLVLFAKKEKIYEQFRQNILKEKYYLAIVQGEVDHDFRLMLIILVTMAKKGSWTRHK